MNLQVKVSTGIAAVALVSSLRWLQTPLQGNKAQESSLQPRQGNHAPVTKVVSLRGSLFTSGKVRLCASVSPLAGPNFDWHRGPKGWLVIFHDFT